MGSWLSGAAQTREPQPASVDCAKTSSAAILVASTPTCEASVVLGVEDIPSAGPAASSSGRVGADGGALVPRKSEKAARKRYYTVTAGPDHLLGVWHASWADLCLHLPTGKLFGSGCRVFGSDSPSEAESKWFDSWASSPPKHGTWPQ